MIAIKKKTLKMNHHFILLNLKDILIKKVVKILQKNSHSVKIKVKIVFKYLVLNIFLPPESKINRGQKCPPKTH